MPVENPDAFLRELFAEAVAVADPMRVIPKWLPEKPNGRVVVLGAGKASARMAEAVESVWGPSDGFVITRYGYGRPTQGIEIVEAAHPVPDAAGRDATAHLMEIAQSLGEDDICIALISGGGSALLTAPAGDITLAEKQEVNAALLRSGAPINDMNIVRKHLSRVKGGQLAAAVHPAKLLCLMISDVPGDDPAAIASGPTVGDPSTHLDAQAIVAHYNIELPESVTAQLATPSTVVAIGDPQLSQTENVIIAAPSQSLDAAANTAKAAGIKVEILGDALEGEASTLGVSHAERARQIQAEMAQDAAPVLLLSGGECTVTGRGTGSGGPNAEYILAMSIALDGQDGIYALACDTDGVDGAAEVAGACIGPDVLARAAAAGVNAKAALAAHDSHGFFGAIDQQVVTGPTLTNVNDFRAVLIYPTVSKI